MIIQAFDIYQLIADIIAFVVRIVQPIVMPIGSWMVGWITFLLDYFPSNNWTMYIIIFIILIITGGTVNLMYPGDKPLKKDEEKGISKTQESSYDEKNINRGIPTKSNDVSLISEEKRIKDFKEDVKSNNDEILKKARRI
ncbi:MAG: hypothetical protein P8Y70_17985 [Candidatus Lokiarchaeota archaeon]